MQHTVPNLEMGVPKLWSRGSESVLSDRARLGCEDSVLRITVRACGVRCRACVSFLLVLVSAVQTWAGPAKAAVKPAESVVAIGDVHNDFDDFVAILRHTGLIDKQNHWTGGKTTFVQVGDLLDRGPKPREVMNLMMALEKEAAQAGGRVVSLLGNHEMMNIMGDLRYVTPMNYWSFAVSNSEHRKKAAFVYTI